jgi:hypothetical protein
MENQASYMAGYLLFGVLETDSNIFSSSNHGEVSDVIEEKLLQLRIIVN